MSIKMESPLYKQVIFRNVRGVAVPCQPWPQSFYVSRVLFERDELEVRPLTFIGLLIGVGKNLVTMNWWRICRVLYALGFLDVEEGGFLALKAWSWHPIRTRAKWRKTVEAYCRKNGHSVINYYCADCDSWFGGGLLHQPWFGLSKLWMRWTKPWLARKR